MYVYSKLIKDLSVQGKTVKLLEDVGDYLYDLSVGTDFFKKKQKHKL